MISIILLSLWLGSGLFHAGWFTSHDGIFHVRRAAEMVEQLRAGFFPVRYAPTLDNNFGIPLFNYVYPGPYYLAAIPNLLAGIGLPTILKLLMFGSLLGGALGWYLYFSKRQEIAWATSLVSLFTPYLLVNIYVRGDLGETLVLGLLPWVFLMQKKVLETGQIKWFTPLPLLIVLISHNFIGYFMLPVLILHFLTFSAHRSHGLLNLGLGIGLASFFWLPMLFERQFLLSASTLNFSFDYRDHFISLWQLVSSPWGYGYSMPGTNLDGMTFQLGYVPILAIIISLYLCVRRSRPFLLAILIFIFFMTSFSAPIWHLFPLLRAVQFPWRLLGLVAVLIPLTVGLSLEAVKSSQLIWGLGVIFLFVGLLNTFNFRAPAKILTRVEFAQAYALWQNGTTTSYRNEIVPLWSPSEHGAQSPEIGTDFRFTKEVSEPTISTFPKNYFPSWLGEVDGNPLALSPSSSGDISFTLLSGSHVYRLYLGSTNLQKFSNLLTLLSLGLLLYLMRYTRA